MYCTPILLITFNRPDHVRRILTEILKQEPQDLYICQDGARESNNTDRIKCQEVRDVVNELTSVYAISHREFTLHTLYQDQNLGCGPGPAAGIDWFFSNVDRGIIMEDDCMPHSDFFAFCEDMLNRYDENSNVQFINATLYHDRWQCDDSYGFSRYMVTGAWAGYRETPKEQYLTYDELFSLTNPLIEIGHHGWEHTAATEMTEEELLESLQKNIEILSAHPRYIPFWAYTWGRHTKSNDNCLLNTGIIPVLIVGNKNYKRIGSINRENFMRL